MVILLSAALLGHGANESAFQRGEDPCNLLAIAE